MEDQQIIQQILDNIINFIEVPHPAFAGMPVCPFARQARIKKQIDIRVLEFSLDEVDQQIMEWVSKVTDQNLLIVVHPNKEIDEKKLNEIGLVYEKLLPDLIVFVSHPLSSFCVDGLYTRREPYPNLQFVTKKHLAEARSKMNPKYYSKMTQENLKDIGLD